VEPEVYLRLRAEELIADANRPAYELLEGLGAFSETAHALVGAGLLAADVAQRVTIETADALVVRGATWIDPSLPELPSDEQLHAAVAGPGDQTLRQVVPIGTTLETSEGDRRTVTTMEVWADSGIVRYADEVGGAGAFTFMPPPDNSEQSLVMQISPGRSVSIDFARGAPVRDASVRTGPANPALYLERLSWAAAAAGDEAPMLAAARTFADLGYHDLAPTPLPLDPAPAWNEERLVTVVPLALRLPAGYAASLELWINHWRLQLPGVGVGAGAVWSATDDDGGRYGGSALVLGTVRFRPAAPEGSRLTVCVLTHGDATEFELF
jgi:hypothetical protein